MSQSANATVDALLEALREKGIEPSQVQRRALFEFVTRPHKPVEDRELFMSARNAACTLGVDKQTVLGWIDSGELKARIVVDEYMIRVGDLEDFVDAHPEFRPKSLD